MKYSKDELEVWRNWSRAAPERLFSEFLAECDAGDTELRHMVDLEGAPRRFIIEVHPLEEED